jgi:uncharacterized membrane protein
MQKNTNVYHNLGYWFLSFIVLAFAGFYTTYFSVLFAPRSNIVHIHFVLMALWIAMLITQPFLIKYKKKALHRLIGKISYVLVPLVLIFSFLMIRIAYYRYLNELHQQTAQGLNHLTGAEILKQAADEPIALFYFVWFALFYILAIVNRRKSSVHARYMLATALTLLGPTVDRIIFLDFKIENIGFIPAYAISFLIANIILAFLLFKDYKNKRPIKTLATCLAIYITGQTLYFIVPGFDWWSSFMTFIMKPAP